ncbi:B2 bradykinin receptor isoform X1 [Nothobranchius furzeri]|uniref:Bradykinin receptor B2 n=3 Tax=Nothobranchius furzeri TaxID=105023 RepID=A0A1A8A7W5_NOTFU|nr:B2 bradykinin receptor [Nothobranchius furzeri]KAF7201616.1 transcript variant X1 [Nothobranchius furzeri]
MDLVNKSFNGNISSGNEDQNNTNQIKCLLLPDDLSFSVIPPYIMIIAILGILLNIFVLMVFCLHKKSCTTAEIYLSNMAAADLLLVSFLPFYAFYVLKRFDWTFGLAMCKLVSMSILMNTYSSIYFMVLIGIDRYLALVHPLFSEGIRRPKFAKLGCVVVWILGFLFSLPALIHRDLTAPINNTKSNCFMNFPSHNVQLTSDLSLSVLGFIIPIFIISFCTIKIIKSLKNRITEGVNAKKVDHKATTLVLAVLLAFLICWVPYHLVKILYFLKDAKLFTSCSVFKLLHICSQIFTYLAYFNSTLNPILYVLVGKNFQKKVKELFRQWDHKRTSTLSNTVSTKLPRSNRSSHNIV